MPPVMGSASVPSTQLCPNGDEPECYRDLDELLAELTPDPTLDSPLPEVLMMTELTDDGGERHVLALKIVFFGRPRLVMLTEGQSQAISWTLAKEAIEFFKDGEKEQLNCLIELSQQGKLKCKIDSDEYVCKITLGSISAAEISLNSDGSLNGFLIDGDNVYPYTFKLEELVAMNL